MRRKVRSALAVIATITMTVTAPAMADAQEARTPVPSVVGVEFDHAVSIADALTAAAVSGVEIAELTLAGNGIVGGLIPRAGAAPSDNAAWAIQAFTRRFGTYPMATGATVRAEHRTKHLEVLLDRLEVASAPPAPPKAVPQLRTMPNQPRLATNFDEHFPTLWVGDTYRAHYPSGLVLHAYDNWFIYENAYGGNPNSFPDDWGLELGITTYKGGFPGVRPYCLPGSDTDYWSSTYNAGGLWGTNVYSGAAPYADTAIYTDSCNDNSVELGIGHPNLLSWDVPYLIFTELFPGTAGSSPMSATLRIASDDCNDLGLNPHTDCMGLNVNRQPPAGVEAHQLLVNKSRGWTVSGCFAMGDGFPEPMRFMSGTAECPWDVHY